jgi:hypothetical protein
MHRSPVPAGFEHSKSSSGCILIHQVRCIANLNGERKGKFQQRVYNRDVPNFGITEISAETEIRFRHLGISISAEMRYIIYLKVAAIFPLLFYI